MILALLLAGCGNGDKMPSDEKVGAHFEANKALLKRMAAECEAHPLLSHVQPEQELIGFEQNAPVAEADREVVRRLQGELEAASLSDMYCGRDPSASGNPLVYASFNLHVESALPAGRGKEIVYYPPTRSSKVSAFLASPHGPRPLSEQGWYVYEFQK